MWRLRKRVLTVMQLIFSISCLAVIDIEYNQSCCEARFTSNRNGVSGKQIWWNMFYHNKGFSIHSRYAGYKSCTYNLRLQLLHPQPIIFSDGWACTLIQHWIDMERARWCITHGHSRILTPSCCRMRHNPVENNASYEKNIIFQFSFSNKPKLLSVYDKTVKTYLKSKQM